MDQKLALYLQATRFCDIDHPSIIKTAEHLCSKKITPKDKALEIFYFARDEIRSGMDRFDLKASETLARQYGGCAGKTNVQIALLRASGIPARFEYIKIRKEVLEPLNTMGLSRLAFTKIPDLLPHVICSVFLNNRWIYAETAFDKEMYNMFYADKYDWNIEWDGETDTIVPREFFVGEFSNFADMDDLFAENFHALPPLFLTKPMFSAANVYSNRLRRKYRDSDSP